MSPQTTAGRTWTAKQLAEALRAHYIPESKGKLAMAGGTFVHEVGVNGVWGAAGNRRCDGLYAGFTSASGRILVGHEIKISRSDWRAELKNLDKADAWADACHAFYVVAPSTDVVPVEELPHGWGLMTPPRTARGRRMKIEVKAEVKTDHDPPWWAVRSMLARLDTLERQERAERVTALVSAALEEKERIRKQYAPTEDSLSPEDRNALSDVRTIERLLGMKIAGYRSDVEAGRVSVTDFARAVQLLDALPGTWAPDSLARTAKDLQQMSQQLAAAAPLLAQLTNPTTKEASDA